jgi:IS5 family transposase
MALDEGIELRQSYTRTVKKLSVAQRLKKNKNGASSARKASKKVKTIAGVLVRELRRKLPANALNKYATKLELFERILSQKRSDSNKIYSIHEPHVKCYSKGKEHKRYEFGSKVSILVTQRTGVIVGALNFSGTEHDTRTLPLAIDQYIRLTGKTPENIFLDRGYPGPKQINGINICIPRPDKNITKTKRKRHGRRAAIEPVIGHLKKDYRLARNYLKGITGDEINVLLSAAAMNFKRVINLWKQRLNNWVLGKLENLWLILFWTQFNKRTF